jgi:hypothetical protein
MKRGFEPGPIPCSNVIAIKGAAQSARKAQWLDQQAQAWDAFTEKFGAEPEAMVYALVGPGTIKSGWQIDGSLRRVGWASMTLLLVAEHLKRQAHTGND